MLCSINSDYNFRIFISIVYYMSLFYSNWYKNGYIRGYLIYIFAKRHYYCFYIWNTIKKPKFTVENMKKVDRLNWSYILYNPQIPVLPHSPKAPAIDIGVLLIYLQFMVINQNLFNLFRYYWYLSIGKFKAHLT